MALSQQLSVVKVPALRGTIFDRTGLQLAVSAPADDISATPYQVHDPAAAAVQLAPLLGSTVDAVTAKLHAHGGFVYWPATCPTPRPSRSPPSSSPGST